MANNKAAKVCLIIGIVTFALIFIIGIAFSVIDSATREKSVEYHTKLKDKDYLAGTEWMRSADLYRKLKKQGKRLYQTESDHFLAGFAYDDVPEMTGSIAFLLVQNEIPSFIKPSHALPVADTFADADMLCCMFFDPSRSNKNGPDHTGSLYVELYNAKTLDYMGHLILPFGSWRGSETFVDRALDSMSQMHALGVFAGNAKLDEIGRMMTGESAPERSKERVAVTPNEENCIFLTYETSTLQTGSVRPCWLAHSARQEPSQDPYRYILVHRNAYKKHGSYSGSSRTVYAYDLTCTAYLLDYETLRVLDSYTTTTTAPQTISAGSRYGVTKIPMADSLAHFQQ